jgi:uncharacterized iron-regulated protein
MKKTLFIALISMILLSFKGDLPAYMIFNQKGKATSWNDLLNEAGKADVVLFGELHDNPICHWMQYELSLHLIKSSGKEVVLGAEMFEADQQLLLNEYLNASITARNFTDQARLWPNHRTDYAPLLKLATEQKVPFIATNIPRRYASLVNREGFEGLEKLSLEAKKYIAPLPISYDSGLPGYKAMLKMGGKEMANANLPKAQAIKDATMAHFILANRTEKNIFLHFHGTYHSNNFEGIYWYLKNQNPDLKILTIASVTQQNIENLEESNIGLGNYILCIPESMTRTH